MKNRTAVVLAAGKGTRMESELPKVLFPVLGRPMIHYVLNALREVGVAKLIVVVGYKAEDLQSELQSYPDVEFVMQTEQLGTGHAVQMAIPVLQDCQGSVVVLAGDSPLVQPSSLNKLFEKLEQDNYACLLGTLERDNPTGLGRIVRSVDGSFQDIVEEKDASDDQRKITEVNMSTYVFEAKALVESLGKLTNDNAQKEYYVTDCPRILLQDGGKVDALPVLQSCEAYSINSRDQLAQVEQVMRDIGYNPA